MATEKKHTGPSQPATARCKDRHDQAKVLDAIMRLDAIARNHKQRPTFLCQPAKTRGDNIV